MSLIDHTCEESYRSIAGHLHWKHACVAVAESIPAIIAKNLVATEEVVRYAKFNLTYIYWIQIFDTSNNVQKTQFYSFPIPCIWQYSEYRSTVSNVTFIENSEGEIYDM